MPTGRKANSSHEGNARKTSQPRGLATSGQTVPLESFSGLDLDLEIERDSNAQLGIAHWAVESLPGRHGRHHWGRGGASLKDYNAKSIAVVDDS